MSKWHNVALSDVMATHIEAIPSADLPGTINLAGVYGFGRGLFKRGETSPVDTTYKAFHRLASGDFVISSPKAWEGALSVIPDAFDGWFLSPVFPTFRADSTRLDTRYLNWYCKRPAVWHQLHDKSTGMGARRESVSAAQFLSLEIPLPALVEQQTIVARLDALADKVRQLNAHLDAVESCSNALVRSYLFGGDKQGCEMRAMSELVTLRAPDVATDPARQYRFAGVYSFGRGVFASATKMGSEFAYDRLSTVHAGDFTYPKLMAWEGALGVVPPECDGMVVSPEFPVFTINTNVVLPEVLDIYFRTPSVWPELSALSGGTNLRRRRLQPTAFLAYEMPVPPTVVQHKIRDLSIRIAALKANHDALRADNAALVPATLERLFARRPA